MQARRRAGPLRELRRRLAPPHFQGTTSSGGDNFSEKIQSFDGRVTKGPERATEIASTANRPLAQKPVVTALAEAGNRQGLVGGSDHS